MQGRCVIHCKSCEIIKGNEGIFEACIPYALHLWAINIFSLPVKNKRNYFQL